MLDAFKTNGSSPPRTFRGFSPGELPPDFLVSNHGSIFLLQPLTGAAHDWSADNLPADALRFGAAIAVEHRYIGDIVAGIQDDGLEVR